MHHPERRYFVATLHGKIGQYYVFERAAQGPRAAPLTFSVMIAMMSRFIRLLMMGPLDKPRRSHALLHVYVDDPLGIFIGNKGQRKRLAAIVSIGWMILGVPLAFHTAILAHSATWIGVQLSFTGDDGCRNPRWLRLCISSRRHFAT